MQERIAAYLPIDKSFDGTCCPNVPIATTPQAHPNANAVFVTTEVTTPAYYGGRDRHR